MNERQAAFNARQIADSMPRAMLALHMREAGKTWAEIGEELGVSRERARQLGVKARRYREEKVPCET